MRGWPLVELVGLTVALALLVIPLHAFTLGRVTRSVDSMAMAVGSETGPEERTAVRISGRFAHAPLRLRVSHGDETIWDTPGSAVVSGDAALLLQEAGIDLRVEVEWPAGTPESVVELTLEPDGLETRSRTAWGRGAVDAILTFAWP